MGLDALQIERDVERLYEAAGVDVSMPTSLLGLLRSLAQNRHDGLRSVRLVSANDDGDPAGRLRRERVANRWEYDIEIARGRARSSSAMSWLLGHEAGEWRVHHLDAAPVESPLCESLANNWAGALIIPGRAFRITWECWDDVDPAQAIEAVAEQFGTTLRVAALRLGEVLGYGVAVIDLWPDADCARPRTQRRGWLANAPVGNGDLVRLAWAPSDAAERGWSIVRLSRGSRALVRAANDF